MSEFVFDPTKYLVFNKEDIKRFNMADRMNLDRAVTAAQVERIRANKSLDRNYIVISDKDPELYNKAMKLLEEAGNAKSKSSA